jgi:hypothetical protein
MTTRDDFRAYYDADKIVVVGKVIEADGSSTTLVRAQPQGINPHVLMLKLQVEPYPGKSHPHIVGEKQLRYEEKAALGVFSEVHIDGANGGFTLKVE